MKYEIETKFKIGDKVFWIDEEGINKCSTISSILFLGKTYLYGITWDGYVDEKHLCSSIQDLIAKIDMQYEKMKKSKLEDLEYKKQAEIASIKEKWGNYESK